MNCAVQQVQGTKSHFFSIVINGIFSTFLFLLFLVEKDFKDNVLVFQSIRLSFSKLFRPLLENSFHATTRSNVQYGAKKFRIRTNFRKSLKSRTICYASTR